jgi:hypothetical protein
MILSVISPSSLSFAVAPASVYKSSIFNLIIDLPIILIVGFSELLVD